MELLAVILVLAVLIWYLGPVINSLVSGASTVMSSRFDFFLDELRLSEIKDYNKLGETLEKTEINHSKSSVRQKLRELNTAE